MQLPVFALDKLDFDKIRKFLISYVSTPTGEQRIQDLTPAGSLEVTSQRLMESAEMLHLLNASESPPLETLEEVSDALGKAGIERFVLDGESLAMIGKWAGAARKLRMYFSKRSDQYESLWRIAHTLQPVKELEEHIHKVLDEKGNLKDDASPELSRINNRIISQKQSARTMLQRILRQGKETGMTSDEEATLRGGRLVIPVKAEYKRKIKGFIHDTSATGHTVYIEPIEVFEANNEIRELESAWRREAERLLRALTQHVGLHTDILRHNAHQIGRVDACYATAKLGMQWNGVIPEISEDGSLILNECRNPLLLFKFNRISEAFSRVIPLNLTMEPDEKGIIITGPNAGGKSVTLKTFGLSLVLALCGIPIPAREGARLPFIKGLYIDMGDEQSIDNDLSTFSSRLNWMKHVLRQSGRNCWVLIDEAGSGTDPDEGTALVKAFLELLSEKGTRSIITTHHGALKIFAHDTEGWSNASMEFDQESLSPTYRFQKGIPGSSYAFEIADRLDVPPDLTHRARQWVGSGKNKLESLIINLEQESQKLQSRKDEISRLEHSWKQSREELDKRLSRVREERDEIRSRAMAEAENLLQNANKKIEEAIRAASEKDKPTLEQKRRDVEKMGSEVREHQKRQKKKHRPTKVTRKPGVGDPVRLLDSNSTGELVEISGKKATVEINGLRIRTRYDNLVVSDKKPAQKPSKGYTYAGALSGNDTVRPFPGSLDIRGKRGEQAVSEVMRYVDEGLSRGMQQLTIVHGKGDGILRKLVHDHLASRSDVKHFETAPIEEGGDGCTYVYF